MGAIRNDTTNKKAFYIRALSIDDERLLYDFNLSLGDTVYWYSNDGDEQIIQGVDSVMYCDNYYKRYISSPNDIGLSYTVIEGIGSMCGLIPNLWGRT